MNDNVSIVFLSFKCSLQTKVSLYRKNYKTVIFAGKVNNLLIFFGSVYIQLNNNYYNNNLFLKERFYSRDSKFMYFSSIFFIRKGRRYQIMF